MSNSFTEIRKQLKDKIAEYKALAADSERLLQLADEIEKLHKSLNEMCKSIAVFYSPVGNYKNSLCE